MSAQRTTNDLSRALVLSARPLAFDDPFYITPADTALTVGTQDTTLLDNDWDAEASSLSGSVVSNPANGALSNFSGTNGTFTYTPDNGFVGIDTFTYKVSDGTDDSRTATVSIAVGGDFGARTNLEEVPQDSMLLTGSLQLTQELTPGVNLLYRSETHARPIIVLETFLRSDVTVPDEIKAQLTFNGSAGTNYSYSTTGLSAGDSLRFALQADASALATGRYAYDITLTAVRSGNSVTRSYSGHHLVVNRDASTHAFGRGWQLEGLDRLHALSGGVMLEKSDGSALWFADDGAGGYLKADGDQSFATLVKNGDLTYTLTDKHGIKANFNSSGLLTSRVDRNGNTVSYSYTSGLLTGITDPFSRSTTLTYTSGRLTSVTDFASRTATLAYDTTNGRLTSVTQVDPDGSGGSQSSPVWSFGYDTTTHQLTSRTNPLSHTTSYQYGSHNRLTKITHPDTNYRQLAALQTKGLPSGATGNSLVGADPAGTVIDEELQSWTFRTDRFGHTTEWTNPLGHKTLTDRNEVGLPVRMTEADPDGAGGPLTSPITIYGYSLLGNLVYQQNPDASTRTWTYTTAFNQVATSTDELYRTTSFAYDTYGNLTSQTDPATFSTTYTYTTRGLVESATSPDPDGASSKTAAVTSFAYDTNGRLTTLTNPDSTTRTFTYDSADNRLTETDELSKTTTFAYDLLNRLTSITNRVAAVISYVYSALGQRIKEIDPLGKATDTEYNSRGWVTKVTRPDPDGGGSLERPETTYGYDGVGNRTSLGEPTHEGYPLSYTYDTAGRLTRVERTYDNFGTSYEYDNLGRVTKETDAHNHWTKYQYNSRGWQTKKIEHDDYADGPTTIYAYNVAGELIQITDPRGYVTSYAYNSRGLEAAVEYADPDGSGPQYGPSESLTYDNAGRLIEVRDHLGRKTEYDYNSRDQLVSVKQPDPDGTSPFVYPTILYGYDATGRQTTVTDPLSRTTTTAYDDEGRVTDVTPPDPDGGGPLTAPVTSYAYDAANRVTSITDARGNVTAFEYDDLGRRTKMTEPDADGGGPLAAPVTIYEYGGQTLPTKITDPLSRQMTFQYDAQGRRTGVTDHLGNQTTFGFDGLDQITSVTPPDPDGGGSQTRPVTSYSYTVHNRLKRITQPDSAVIDFTYDAAGNLLSVKDPVNNTTSYSYDGLARSTIESNALSDSRSFVYDTAGHLMRRTDRNARVMQYSYDELDRQTRERWFTGATPGPETEILTITGGGPINEVQRVGFTGYLGSGTFTLSFGGATTSAIDYNASAATVQAALEGLSTIGTGNVGVTKLQDTSETQEWQLTFQGSQAATNVVQTTVDSSSVSGPYGPPTDIEETNKDGGIYDEVQEVTISGATGGTFRLAFAGYTTAPIAYDASATEIDTKLEELGSIDTVSVTGNAGGPWTITFTGSHSQTDVERLNGDISNLTNGTLTRTIDRTFDLAGQLTAISDSDSSYAYTFDNLGRVLTSSNSGTAGVPTVVLTSSYDAASNRTSLSASIGGTADFLNSYTYDALDRLTRVDQTGQSGGNTVAEKRVDLAYNGLGQFTQIARYKATAGGSINEVATSDYSYDTLGRLTGLSYKKGGANLFTAYSWTYDSLSLPVDLLEFPGADPRVAALAHGAVFQGLGRVTQFTSQDGTSDYSYDSKSQLTAADHSYQGDESYSFDANGNRTMTGYSTGTNNQLLNDGTYSYVYDDEGNRTRRTHDTTGEVTEYEWDHRNRLVEVTEKDSLGAVTQVVVYTYDVFNRRISKGVDTTSPFDLADAAIERYVLDDLSGVASPAGGNVVLDFEDPDGSGSTAVSLEKRYLYGNAVDQVLAQEDVDELLASANRVLWHLTDNLGTVRDLAKNDGTIATHYKYDSFGKVVSGDTSLTRYLFTSREFDTETRLQYNRARWYDPEVGRWVGEDPIAYVGGDANIQRYVGNSPHVVIDPAGLQGANEPLPSGEYPYEMPSPPEAGDPTTPSKPNDQSIIVPIYMSPVGRSEILDDIGVDIPEKMPKGSSRDPIGTGRNNIIDRTTMPSNYIVGPDGCGPCLGVTLVPSVGFKDGIPDPTPIGIFHFTYGDNVRKELTRFLDFYGSTNYVAIMNGAEARMYDQHSQVVGTNQQLTWAKDVLNEWSVPITYVPRPSVGVDRNGRSWDATPPNNLVHNYDPSLDYARESRIPDTTTPRDWRSKSVWEYKHYACFVSGTVVLTSDGARAIETIAEHDTILAFDVQQRVLIPTKVQKLDVHIGTFPLLEVVTSNDDKVSVTAGHPFFDGDNWIMSEHLGHAQPVMLGNGKRTRVYTRDVQNMASVVYNLQTEVGNYLVGKSGFVVSGQVVPSDSNSPRGGRMAMSGAAVS